MSLTPRVDQIENITPPVGCIMAYAGASAPIGWAFCDGATLDRITHSRLFEVIGTNFGAGDGSTTFHLPDLRGRFMRGVNSGTGRDPNAGARTASNAGGATGDNVGSVQNDAMQRITGSMDFYSSDLRNDSGALSREMISNMSATDQNLTSRRNRLELDSNTSPGARTSTETRSKNVNVHYIIKI